MCFGWGVVFHNKQTNKHIKDGGKNGFPTHECGSSGGIYLSQIELNTVKNYEIKGMFVFAFYVIDNSGKITIILGPPNVISIEKRGS